MIRPGPQPRTPAAAPGLAAALVLAFAILGLLPGATTGCNRSTRGPFTLLTNPVPVVASALDREEITSYLIEARGPNRAYEVRTSINRLTPQPEAELRQRVAWTAPYLFIREDNGGGNGWRADVDHVFKFQGNRLHRVGTVSAHFGKSTGAAYQEGRFLDYYDRLEFTPLTAHAGAPRITLVMAERNGRFEVDIEETWKRAKDSYDVDKADLEERARNPRPEPNAEEVGNDRGLVLRCLTVTRYCGRQREHDACQALARRLLRDSDMAYVLEEVATVKPGELAPSFEEVFRIHPGLINVFPESGGTGTDADAADPAPEGRPRGLLAP